MIIGWHEFTLYAPQKRFDLSNTQNSSGSLELNLHGQNEQINIQSVIVKFTLGPIHANN